MPSAKRAKQTRKKPGNAPLREKVNPGNLARSKNAKFQGITPAWGATQTGSKQPAVSSAPSRRRLWVEKFNPHLMRVALASAAFSAALVIVICAFLLYEGVSASFIIPAVFPVWLFGTVLAFASLKDKKI